MKLSSVPLCQAGDWGLQTPETCLCFGFFAASPQKNQNTKGFGASPQWEICVSFMRMGLGVANPRKNSFCGTTFCGEAAKGSTTLITHHSSLVLVGSQLCQSSIGTMHQLKVIVQLQDTPKIRNSLFFCVHPFLVK